MYEFQFTECSTQLDAQLFTEKLDHHSSCWGLIHLLNPLVPFQVSPARAVLRGLVTMARHETTVGHTATFRNQNDLFEVAY